MATENFPPREVTALVSLFQRAHNKIVALQKLDDQIALLVEQHCKLQDEVRGIRTEINEAFERALKSNQAPAKLAAARTLSTREEIQPNFDGEASSSAVGVAGELIPLAE